MARIFIDGFESGNLDLWVNENYVGVPTLSTITGKTGNYCLRCYGSQSTYMLPVIKSSLYVAMKVYAGNQSSTRTLITFRDSAGTALGCICFGSNRVNAYWGDKSTLITQGTAVVQNSTWYRIEIYYLPHLTAGTFIVKVDGTTDINVSGVKTSSATSNIGRIQLSQATTDSDYSFDDIVLDDANWIGNTRIMGLAPSGVGNANAWSGDAKLTWDRSLPDNSWGGINYRIPLAAANISKSGTSIRIRAKVGNSACNISGCSIGERSGSTGAFVSTPTRITFGGNNYYNATTYESFYSDWITFTIDETKDYLVHFYCVNGLTYYSHNSSVTNGYNDSTAADETLTLNPAMNPNNYCAFLESVYVSDVSSANNYQAVDELIANDGDYVYTSTQDAVDTYALANGSGGVIHCVAVQSRAWKEGASSVEYLKHVVRPDTVNFSGELKYLPTSAISKQTIWEMNPADAAAWEWADINGMEIGIKAVVAS